MPEDNIGKITDPTLYDGWCCELNTQTKKITWRSAWFTDRLTESFKRVWEEKFRSANPQLFQS